MYVPPQTNSVHSRTKLFAFELTYRGVKKCKENFSRGAVESPLGLALVTGLFTRAYFVFLLDAGRFKSIPYLNAEGLCYSSLGIGESLLLLQYVCVLLKPG